MEEYICIYMLYLGGDGFGRIVLVLNCVLRVRVMRVVVREGGRRKGGRGKRREGRRRMRKGK